MWSIVILTRTVSGIVRISSSSSALNSRDWFLAVLGPLLLRGPVVVPERIGGCVPGFVEGLHDRNVEMELSLKKYGEVELNRAKN